MTKAFMVYFKEQPYANNLSIGFSSSPIPFGTQSCSVPYSQYTQKDNRPILVIARTIDEAAVKYKNAIDIQELDVKDVIIDEKIDIIFEKR